MNYFSRCQFQLRIEWHFVKLFSALSWRRQWEHEHGRMCHMNMNNDESCLLFLLLSFNQSGTSPYETYINVTLIC